MPRLTAPLLLAPAAGHVVEMYSTNSICRQNKCVNPIFPGLEDMARLASSENMYTCGSLEEVQPLLHFCAEVVTYSPALLAPTTTGPPAASSSATTITGPQAASSSATATTELVTTASIVKRMERGAMTTFVYHVSGLGLEPADAMQSRDPCMMAIRQLACLVHFPRAEAGCAAGQAVDYVRPCQTSCLAYVDVCAVECCDESVQCTFEHVHELSQSGTKAVQKIRTSGFAPQEAPSASCSSSRSNASSASAAVALAAVLAMVVDGGGGHGGGGHGGGGHGGGGHGGDAVGRTARRGHKRRAPGSVAALVAVALACLMLQGFRLGSARGAVRMHFLVGSSSTTAASASASSTLAASLAASSTAAYSSSTAQMGGTSLLRASSAAAASAAASAKETWDVAQHRVGNWRKEDDYLLKYQFVGPGQSAQAGVVNSCSFPNLAQAVQCSGHGLCAPFDGENLGNPLAFCQCDRDWAGPECAVARKSQAVAYVLSLFLGWTGADQFFLGFPIAGAGKLVSLGGFGVWWLLDVVRIGSENVYTAHQFRLAADMPRWVFVLSSVSLWTAVGFALAGFSLRRSRKQRRAGAGEEAEVLARMQASWGQQ